MSKKKETSSSFLPATPVPIYELKKNVSDFNMMVDLDNDFYEMANRCVRALADENQIELASNVKTIVKVLEALYKKYVLVMLERSQLIPRIDDADEKLQYSLKLTDNAEKSMNSLKQALENAWQIADASRIREQNLEDKLKQISLKCKSFSLKEEVRQPDADEELGKLAKFKHIILKERDRLQSENMELLRRLKIDRIYREQVEKHREDVEERIDKIQKKLDNVLTEKLAFENRLKNAKEEITESTEANRALILKNNELEKKIQDQLVAMKNKNKEKDGLRNQLEHIKNELALSNQNFIKVSSQLAYANQDKKLLQDQNKNLKADLKEKSGQVVQKTKKLKKCENDYAIISSQIAKMNKTIHGLKEEVLKLRNFSNSLEKALLESGGNYDNLKKLKEVVTHERDTLRTDAVKINSIIADLRCKEKLKENELDALKLQIQRINIKLDEAKRSISQVAKVKEEQGQEIQGLNDRIDGFKEQLQLKMDQLLKLNEQLNQKQSAFIKTQKLLETTNSERLMLQKSLQSCCEERINLKSLVSKGNHQITQLTEEIMSSQKKINTLNLQVERLRSEKKDVEIELHSAKSMLYTTRVELKEIKQKNEALAKTITEDEREFVKLSLQLEEVRKEKNLVGLQMVRRNDEIMLLKERVQICQAALDNGKVQYDKRIEDIRLLKLEISDSQTQKSILVKSLESTANMREELIRLQRVLSQERVRNRILLEDLNTPANIHRWRLLSGVDPDRHQLIEKVQILQRQILKQQVQGMQKENALKEMQNIYLSMKSYLAKLPPYYIKADLVEKQRIINRKNRKMKALAAELTILQMDVTAGDCLIKKLQMTLRECQNPNDKTNGKAVTRNRINQ